MHTDSVDAVDHVDTSHAGVHESILKHGKITPVEGDIGWSSSKCLDTDHSVLSVSLGTRMYVNVILNGVQARALVDTGATLSCISTDFLSRYKNNTDFNVKEMTPLSIKVADNSTYRSLSSVEGASIHFQDDDESFKVRFVSMPLPNKVDALLGTDFLNEHQALI